MEMFSTTTYLIDKHRGLEKMNAHHEGQAQYLVDIVRQAAIFSEIAHYHEIHRLVKDSEDWDVEQVNDRFKVPADNGYRDLKFLVRLKKNGHICTLRFVHRSMLDSQRSALPADEEIAYIEGSAKVGSGEAFVVAMDNFHYAEPEGRTLISGFPDLGTARDYAAKRMTDIVTRLKPLFKTEADMLVGWYLFGEALVVGSTREQNFEGGSEKAFLQCLANSSSPNAGDADWPAMDLGFSLRASRL